MRYVALLRGVSPGNDSMPKLKACFEGAGFENVRTLLSSGITTRTWDTVRKCAQA